MRPDEVFIGRECDETGRWDFRPFAEPAFNDVKIISIRTFFNATTTSASFGIFADFGKIKKLSSTGKKTNCKAD